MIGVLAYLALLIGCGVLSWLSIRAWRRGESPPDLSAALSADVLPVFSTGMFAGLLLVGIARLLGDPNSTLGGIGAAAMAAAFLLHFSIGLTGRPQALVPPVLRKEPRFAPDRGGRHRGAVMNVRPPPGEDGDGYYVPRCSCDWVGDVYETPEPAFEEARRHTPNVSTRLERPVG